MQGNKKGYTQFMSCISNGLSVAEVQADCTSDDFRIAPFKADGKICGTTDNKTKAFLNPSTLIGNI